MKKDLPQMELYCEMGRLVNSRPEKGTVMAAMNASRNSPKTARIRLDVFTAQPSPAGRR